MHLQSNETAVFNRRNTACQYDVSGEKSKDCVLGASYAPRPPVPYNQLRGLGKKTTLERQPLV